MMKYKNNPCNIRYVERNCWLGQIAPKKGFCQFKSCEYGFRAVYILLRRYHSFGCKTFYQIFKRFAPASDGNYPLEYAKFVASQCGLKPTDEPTEHNYVDMVVAMARLEQGSYDPKWYDYALAACGLCSPVVECRLDDVRSLPSIVNNGSIKFEVKDENIF